MIATLALLVLTAAEPVKLAAPGLSIVNMKPELKEFLTEHIAQELTKHGVRMVTPKQIEAVLGLERQKQLLGCSDTGSECAIELANALGVDALLTGEIGKLGEAIQVNLKIISPVNTQQLAAWTRRVNGEGELFDALAEGAGALARQLYTALGREAPIAMVEKPLPPLRKLWWVPALVGGLAVGIGAYYVGDAYGAKSELTTPGTPLDPVDAGRIRARGELSQTIGWVGIGVGSAALVATVLFWVVPAPAQAAVVPLKDGAAFSLSGTFP